MASFDFALDRLDELAWNGDRELPVVADRSTTLNSLRSHTGILPIGTVGRQSVSCDGLDSEDNIGMKPLVATSGGGQNEPNTNDEVKAAVVIVAPNDLP